jgi:hypothetical protein
MTQQNEPGSENKNLPVAPQARKSKWSFGAALGAGRTSVRRGLIALLVAPALAVLPLLLLFLVFEFRAPWEEGIPMSQNLAGVLLLLEMGFGMVAAVTIAFGGPTWIVLRLIRKESARTYVLAGMVGGLLWAFFFLYSSAVAWTVERIVAFAFASASGGVVALGFWLIARDPRHGGVSQ